MRKQKLWRLLFAALAAGCILTGCGRKTDEMQTAAETSIQETIAEETAVRETPANGISADAPGAEAEEFSPGTITDGIFRSRNGRYTLHTPESDWEVSNLDGFNELRLRENPSVAITFSYLEDVPEGLLVTFENEFTESFIEGLRGQYEEVEKQKTYAVSDDMAGFSVTMTEAEQKYTMYQLFYLAVDTEDACMITSILPAEDAGALEPKVREAIESFAFEEP